MPIAWQGDLDLLINMRKARGETLTELEVTRIMFMIADGLSFIHS
jgi:hypothetical protein